MMEHQLLAIIKSATKHGGAYTKAYGIYRQMKDRCYNKSNPQYKNYGARGIKVCERWMDFSNFYKDMGEKPNGLSLDRIDGNGNYELSNCRWATWYQQNCNTRRNVFITLFGNKIIVSEASRILGVGESSFYRKSRKNKISLQEAIIYFALKAVKKAIATQ